MTNDKLEIRDKIFLVTGKDSSKRQAAIDLIKKKLVKNGLEAFSLNLYAKEVTQEELQKVFFTFSFNKERIVVFRNCLKIPQNIKDFFVNRLKDLSVLNYLIFDFEDDYSVIRSNKKLANDKFFVMLSQTASLIKTTSFTKDLTVQDFKWSLKKGDIAGSLFILDKLFSSGRDRELGPLILGILVREFSYERSPERKEKLLGYLWQADREIKEKGLSSRLVLEKLLVKAGLNK